MNNQASIPVSDPQRSEREQERQGAGTALQMNGGAGTSTKAFHKYIFSLIAMLGVLLQLKQGTGTTSSLFDTHYTTVVILAVALIIYSGLLISAPYILQAHLNLDSEKFLDLEKFLNTISVLFGVLALVLELVILLPALGVAALLFWIVWFVSFVAYSYPQVKTLFTSAVAGVVHAYEKLKEYLKNMKKTEQSG